MKLIPALLLALFLLNACANTPTVTPSVSPPTVSVTLVAQTPFAAPTIAPPQTPLPTTSSNGSSSTNTPLPPTPVFSEPTDTPTVFPTPFAGTLTLTERQSFRVSCEQDGPFGLASKAFDLIAFLPTGDCQNGEIGLFKIGGKTYIAQSGLFDSAYTLTDVTNPSLPQIIGVWDLGVPSSTLDLKPFRQGDKFYLALGLQRNRQQPTPPCGIVIVAVTDVKHPQLVTRLDGRVVGAPDPWCNVHTLEVDTDGQGNATFLIVSDVDTYSARAVDIHDLQNPREVNFYHLHDHPHAVPGQPVLHYVHDSYISDDKIYLAYWLSGVVILDKKRFDLGLPQEPVIVKPTENVAPGGFHAHYTLPIANGDFIFIQDELNADNGLRLLDIRDPQDPKTVWTETNSGGVNAPHNFVIRDNLIFVAWYNDGVKVFQFDITNPDKPTVQPVAFQQVREKQVISRERYFDGVWGVRVDDCQLQNAKRVCVYASDMSTGLIVLALKP